ncbi:MAG: hypothetical protein EBZ48_08865, partial [Proteobacteria bacterium]|nr:hypothetical protein [Pseudomonadota bacterium]
MRGETERGPARGVRRFSAIGTLINVIYITNNVGNPIFFEIFFAARVLMCTIAVSLGGAYMLHLPRFHHDADGVQGGTLPSSLGGALHTEPAVAFKPTPAAIPGTSSSPSAAESWAGLAAPRTADARAFEALPLALREGL